MANTPDNMDKRRKRREAQRKKQQMQRRRLRLGLLAAVVLLGLCGGALYYFTQSVPAEQLSSVTDRQMEATAAPTEAPTEATRAPYDPITTIHIRAAGDLNITDSVVDSGLSQNGYDFTRAFQDVASTLSNADLTVMNLEGNICGEPYGTDTTSAPRELATALKNAGVDLVQMANTYTVKNGIIGLTQTLQQLRSAGIEPLGAYASNQDFKTTKGYTICNVGGIKVAFVAFTKGLGGMGLPAGNENCVNLLYTDYNDVYNKVDTKGITAILDNVAAEKPDVTVAMLHWGSENSENITTQQERIITLLQKKGVNVIIGSHPHLLQKITFSQSAGTLVAYSLGDLIGDATHAGTNYSIILDVEITKYADSGTTKVTAFSYVPIYTVKSSECVAIRQEDARRVFRIRDAMSAYEGNYVDRVTADAYAGMQKALTRIEERIQGKSQETKKS